MPLPRIQRGELWLVDLGYLDKVWVVEEALAHVLGLNLASAELPGPK